MKKRLLAYLAAIIFVTGAGGASLNLATPTPAYAQQSCTENLLTFPAWYQGLVDGNCNIKSPSQVGGISNFIWAIALNVLEIMLQMVGYAAIIYLMYGGYKYMTSLGSSDGMTKARQTITHAVIGLVISIFSVAAVTLIAGGIG